MDAVTSNTILKKDCIMVGNASMVIVDAPPQDHTNMTNDLFGNKDIVEMSQSMLKDASVVNNAVNPVTSNKSKADNHFHGCHAFKQAKKPSSYVLH